MNLMPRLDLTIGVIIGPAIKLSDLIIGRDVKVLLTIVIIRGPFTLINALCVEFLALGTAILQVLALLTPYLFTLIRNMPVLHGSTPLCGARTPMLVWALRWNGLAELVIFLCRVNKATVCALPLYTLVNDLLVP